MDLIALSQYYVYVINSIIHKALYVLVARDFYSNGGPVVALATIFALVLFVLDSMVKSFKSV